MSAIAVAGVVTGLLSNNASKSAAGSATSASNKSAILSMLMQKQQMDQTRATMAPWTQGGAAAQVSQEDLMGINGPDKQQAAIQMIQSSPEFAAMQKQGENGILQNASATGGLRGGNVQAALAQFRPQILSQLIQQHLGQLGGMSALGENAGLGLGNFGANSANQMSGAAGLYGSGQMGGALANGFYNSSNIQGIGQSVGMAIPALAKYFNSAPSGGSGLSSVNSSNFKLAYNPANDPNAVKF